MKDINTLLKEQDPIIDDISRNVEHSISLVDRGTKNVKDTRKMLRPF